MYTKDNKDRPIYVRLTTDWYEELKILSEIKQIPMSTIARQAIIEYITRETED